MCAGLEGVMCCVVSVFALLKVIYDSDSRLKYLCSHFGLDNVFVDIEDGGETPPFPPTAYRVNMGGEC